MPVTPWVSYALDDRVPLANYDIPFVREAWRAFGPWKTFRLGQGGTGGGRAALGGNHYFMIEQAGQPAGSLQLMVTEGDAEMAAGMVFLRVCLAGGSFVGCAAPPERTDAPTSPPLTGADAGIATADMWPDRLAGYRTDIAAVSEYRSIQEQLARGWNTWDTRDVLRYVLLPEGLAVDLAIKRHAWRRRMMWRPHWRRGRCGCS